MHDLRMGGHLSDLAGDDAAGSLLGAILDGLPDAIIVVDRTGHIRHAAGPVAALTGYQAEDLIGRSVEDLVPLDRRRQHRLDRDAYGRNPQSRPMGADLDIQLHHRSGRQVPVDISLSPVSAQGEQFVVAAVRDAAPRRETERRVDQMRMNLVRAVSHDLRSPLASMMGLAMTVEEHLDQLRPEQVRDMLRRLRRNGRRLDELIANLLDLDRLTRGDVEPRRQQVDLVALVAHVLEDMELSPSAVHVEAPTDLLWDVDASQVERIVENLVGNAHKHAPSDQPVTVRLEQCGEEVILSVEDRGPGVPDAEKQAIFEPFVRGRRTGAPGTGVGLSLVDQFARVHGGRAWVEDRPGGGATFRVSLAASS